MSHALKPARRVIAVGLHEAALDSPTFRATAVHYADQIDSVEKWLNGYVSSTSKLVHDILTLEETINSYIFKTNPSVADGVIDNDYTFLALKRVGDGSREVWMQMLSSMKRIDQVVVEPVRSFLVGDLRNFKEIRKVLEHSQRHFDTTLGRYVAQSKTKEPSALREDAFAVYEARKAYLQAAMDFCQLAPQVRFTMDKLLVRVSNEVWKEMGRWRDSVANATRFSQEMERVRGWAKEMESAENIFRRELHAARRDVGEDALTGCKPSRELEDYSTSTVPFLGSRGPLNISTDEGAVISEKQGWLFLRTLSGKPARHNWVRRWYYCRNGVFGWLIPGPHGVLQGDEIGVLLCNAKPAVGEDRRFCFEVKTKSQNLMLQAETQSELTEWLEVFEVSKKKAFEASMSRDAAARTGGADPAFSISPPGIPEFSARTLDVPAEDPSAGVERSLTLPVPGQDVNLAARTSFDVNSSVSRRSITALGRELARDEGESGREHAARIIQKLDLHRKATFGPSAEHGNIPNSNSAGGLSTISNPSNTGLPGQVSLAAKRSMLPSVDSHPGTLAPLTLAKPPATTGLSRVAVYTVGERGSGNENRKLLPSIVANYWGSSVWGAVNTPHETQAPYQHEDDPIGMVVSKDKTKTPLAEAISQKQNQQDLPSNYPSELRAQYAQFRLLFPSTPLDEKLVLVFRAAWSSSAGKESKARPLAGDGRIYVTPDNMYFYGQQMGLVEAYSISLDIISEVTASPGRDCDCIHLQFGASDNDTGYSRVTIKLFLDDMRVVQARLNLLIDDLQAEEQMDMETLVQSLINIEREEFEKPSPSAESWEEIPANTPFDDGTAGGRSPRIKHTPASPRITVTGSQTLAPKLHLPTRPVIYEPEDMTELAAERHFEIGAKACFHVLFGDKSFVFPKLYFERRSGQIAQGPWEMAGPGQMKREFSFNVEKANVLGQSKSMDIVDRQVIELLSDHVTYVVKHTRTAWHLPHSGKFKLVTKIVITHVAKSKCKLAIYTRVDWHKSPKLAKGLVDKQAQRYVADDAEELAELATDQVRKLGLRSRTNRAIQVYGHIGQQTEVVVFSPAAAESSKKQAINPRTLTALVWEVVRSFLESAVSSIIMWTVAGVKKMFGVVTANRLILVLLGASVLTNLAWTSGETAVWWKERRAAQYMRSLGIGPNTMMSKAIYIADLPEITGTAGKEPLFPHNSTCFSSFKDVMDSTNMDAPWDQAGATFSSALTKATAQRLRRTRQRLGVYRHELLVGMRVVNSVEREMMQSEWENWLMNEKMLCDDLGAVLKRSGGKGSSLLSGDKATMAQKVMSTLSPDRRKALEEWKEKHCGSCQQDYASVMSERQLPM